MPSTDWSKYNQATDSGKPRSLLVEALKYVKEPGDAIDIGAGALNDSNYLLGLGFAVTALDSNPSIIEDVKRLELDPTKFELITSRFEDFKFPTDRYILASAMYALPFIDPASFNRVLNDIISSLKSGGILSATFFGPKDGWSHRAHMSFRTESEIREALSSLEIISFDEKETDEETALGKMKHWHIFDVIAEKR